MPPPTTSVSGGRSRGAAGASTSGSMRTAEAFSSACRETGSSAGLVNSLTADSPGREVQRTPVERCEGDAFGNRVDYPRLQGRAASPRDRQTG